MKKFLLLCTLLLFSLVLFGSRPFQADTQQDFYENTVIQNPYRNTLDVSHKWFSNYCLLYWFVPSIDVRNKRIKKV